jgi:hypothetical protein
LIKESDIYKDFEGGRYGHSSEYLTLKIDSSYNYSQWFHHRSHTIRDSGTWKLSDTLLTLNSYSKQTVQSVTPRYKRRKKKFIFDTITNTFTVFKNKTFIYKNEKIYLFDQNKIKSESDKDYYHTYHILYEKK